MTTTTPLSLEDREILFPNFSGTPSKFNRDGRRTFSVIIQENEVDALIAQGWNVKRLKPKDEDDLGTAHLVVRVNLDSLYPPKIVVMSHTYDGNGELNELGRNILTERNVNTLDWADIISADMTVNPYYWEIPDAVTGDIKSGVTAYLQTLYVKVLLDPIEAKWSDASDELG